VFTITEAKKFDILLQVAVGASISRETLYPMLNSGDTALPYEPYFDGLRSAAVTEVESVGINIWDEEFEVGYIDLSTGNLMYDANLLRSKNFIPVKPSVTYYMYNGSWNEYRIAFYDRSKNIISAEATNPFTTPQDCTFIKFYWSGTEYNHDISINKSGAAYNGKYYPYRSDTLPIPAAVQALDGYGLGINADCYNYIDWDKKQFVKRIERVVLNGSADEIWDSYLDSDSIRNDGYCYRIYLVNRINGAYTSVCATMERITPLPPCCRVFRVAFIAGQ
jgi:hypothetical protein